MLKLMLIEDEKQIIELQNKYYNKSVCGANIALNCDGLVIGMLTYSISDEVTIRAVYLEEEYRGKGLGDFLIRASLNILTNTNMDIVIGYEDEKSYYEKFGFCKAEGKLKCSSAEIVFPSKCGGH